MHCFTWHKKKTKKNNNNHTQRHVKKEMNRNTPAGLMENFSRVLYQMKTHIDEKYIYNMDKIIVKKGGATLKFSFRQKFTSLE